MARRSILVAIAAVVAALAPASAQAATIGATQAPFASPVTFSWTPRPRRADRDGLPCSRARARTPAERQWRIRRSPSRVPLSPRSRPTPRATGVFCYYVQDDAGSNGRISNPVQVTVDTLAPTGTVAVTPLGAPNFLRGVVTISGTSADTGSGVLSSVLHIGAVGNCAAGAIAAALDTTTHRRRHV